MTDLAANTKTKPDAPAHGISFGEALIVWLRVTKGVAASERTGPLIGGSGQADV